MRIKEITTQTRCDFQAIYECEHCGHIQEGSGYDDVHFHNSVIPEMVCIQCGLKAGHDYVPRATKYKEGDCV